MTAGHVQIGHQLTDRFRDHGGPVVSMDDQLTGWDVLFSAGLLDEPGGQLPTFLIGDQPPGDIAAEYVDDDVEVVIGVLHGTPKQGDVPGP